MKKTQSQIEIDKLITNLNRIPKTITTEIVNKELVKQISRQLSEEIGRKLSL